MINFKSLLETVYEPKSGDEKNFKDKHVVVKYKTPYDTESQFTSNLPKAKRKADHDKGEDENVYEAAEVHTKRADKQAIIVRAVDPKTGESKARVVQRRAGEIKIGEDVEQIDELSDDDIDNDGGVDKYLHARRKAIGRALCKESIDEAAEYTMKQLQKKFEDGTHEAMNDPVPGRHVELRNTKTGKRTTHYVKEEWYKDANGKEYPFSKPFDSKSNAHEFAKKNGLSKRDVKSRPAGYVVEKPSIKEETELSESDVKYVIKHKKTKQVLNTHDDYATAKDEHEGLGDEKSEYGVYKQTKKDAALRNRNTYREEVEYIDEAVKIGAMKLHDGSSIIVTREMADKLNNVLEQLNPTNRVKMEEKLHTSKKDFMELLKFAENI